MKPFEFNILATGLGGQGILTLARVISNVASRLYPFACRTEVRGLSQRGGSVTSDIRIGEKMLTPVIGLGEADLLVSLDLLETVRLLPYLKPECTIISNGDYTVPAHLSVRWTESLPDTNEIEVERLQTKLTSVISNRSNAHLLDLTAIGKAAGNVMARNSALLGASTHFLPSIPWRTIQAELLHAIKGDAEVHNVAAFEMGRHAIDNNRSKKSLETQHVFTGGSHGIAV